MYVFQVCAGLADAEFLVLAPRLDNSTRLLLIDALSKLIVWLVSKESFMWILHTLVKFFHFAWQSNFHVHVV